MKSSSYDTESRANTDDDDFDVSFGERNNGVTHALPHPPIMLALATIDDTKKNKPIAEELAKQVFTESSQNVMGKRALMNTVQNNNTAPNRFVTF